MARPAPSHQPRCLRRGTPAAHCDRAEL